MRRVWVSWRQGLPTEADLTRAPLFGFDRLSGRPSLTRPCERSPTTTRVRLGNHGTHEGLVVRSIKTLTFHAMSRSKLRQRNCTGASFISAMPWRMRDFSSAVDATRMWRRKVRAILEKGALDQVQPGAVFWSMNVFEAPRSRRQVRHGLAGNVRGVIVEDDADDGVGRIVTMQALQQGDELRGCDVAARHRR